MNYYFLIDIPGDSQVLQKISEKQQRYENRSPKMWSYSPSVAPIIIGSLGSIPRGLKDQLKSLQIYHSNLIPKMQKSVLLSSCHILCHFVTEH